MTGGRNTSPASRRSSLVSGSAPPIWRTRRRCRSIATPTQMPCELVSSRHRSCRTAAGSTPDARHGGRQWLADVRLHRASITPSSGRSWTTCERSAGPVDHVGVDGCGAPAPTVSLIGSGVRCPSPRRRWSSRPSGHELVPEMVGGPTRDVTRLMRLVPGLLAKDGAEGVQVVALPDGRAVALKVADGGGARGRRSPWRRCARSMSPSPPTRSPSRSSAMASRSGCVRSLVGEP